MSNKDVNIVTYDDLDPEKFSEKDADGRKYITVSSAVAVSKHSGNRLEQLDDGLYIAEDHLQPVINEPTTAIVKKYLTLRDMVEPSEPYLANERAIIEHRNGLNILHLDIKFKKPTANPKSNYQIASLPSDIPKFNALTEYQILGDGMNGFIYVNANSSAVMAKGVIPANTRIVVKLIGFTR